MFPQPKDWRGAAFPGSVTGPHLINSQPPFWQTLLVENLVDVDEQTNSMDAFAQKLFFVQAADEDGVVFPAPLYYRERFSVRRDRKGCSFSQFIATEVGDP